MIKFNKQILLVVTMALMLSMHQVARSQTPFVEGTVTEKSDTKGGMVLPGATVLWANTTYGTTTDERGRFKLEIQVPLPAWLLVSYVGYQTDSILIQKPGSVQVKLKSSISLNSVTIEGRQNTTLISTIKPINSEQIGQKELLKAACCNLSESFETNPSVNVSYSDAITGAKEIQMLGLSGIYSQIMLENIPNIRGLAATYGLGYVPGPWMESIQITKGSGSVANGYESTSGQINVEFLKPEKAPDFYLNGYGASTGNIEVNAHKKIRVSENTSGIFFVHGESMQNKIDHQDDGFLDMPLMQQANIFNRWSYNDGRKFEGQFGIKGIFEKRRSGQTGYDWSDQADSSTGYGVQIATRRFELFSKTGMIFPEKPWKSAGLILSGSIHDQESYFGLKTYDGLQNSFYGSLIYMSIIGTTNHKWKTGIDFRYDDYSEKFMSMPHSKMESVPGVYAEYTLNVNEKFGAVAGSRVDYHNEWEWIYTPRLHLKYNFTPDIIVRASGGRSFRTANVFAENISIMATSRDLVIVEELQPERAWNFGSNFTANFKMWYRPGTFSIDYYVTSFTDQVIVDAYSSENQIRLYNLEGDSYSKSFQAALNYEAAKRFDVRLAYKNDEVVMDYNGVASRKPLVPEHRALLNIGYATRKENWKFDFTTHYQGRTRLAISSEMAQEPSGHNDDQVKNGQSPEFYTFNGQITYVIKNWDIYLGGENLSDFRQETPVVHAMHPFEEGFDATNVWGPVMGRKIYLGFRYTLKPKQNVNKQMN